MSRNFQAIVFGAPNEIELRHFDLPACGPKEIGVKTLYTMVWSGTEGRVLAGHYGAEGKFPLIPGYSVVGEVVEVGADANGWKVGDVVSAGNPQPVAGIHHQWGGHASHHLYNADNPVLLPVGAAPLDYVVAELAAISFRGVTAAAPKRGETAAVIGQGLIGAFSSTWLGVFGCRVVVADVAPSRLERALKRGVAATVNARDADAAKRLQSLCGGADIVVESSGNARGFVLATSLLKEDWSNGAKRDAPRLVLQANYIKEIPLNPCGFFGGEAKTVWPLSSICGAAICARRISWAKSFRLPMLPMLTNGCATRPTTVFASFSIGRKPVKSMNFHFSHRKMRLLGALGLLTLMLTTDIRAQTASSPAQVLAQRQLPELLAAKDGQSIRNEAQWRVRRAEILELFRSQVYGRAPLGRPADLRFRVEKTDPLALGGGATLKQIAIEFSGLKRVGQQNAPLGRINLLLFTPNARPKPAPTFLLISHRGAQNLDATRVEKTEFWPVEQLIARGYGAAAFLASDLDPDNDDGFKNGVHGLFDPTLKPGETRAGDAWGTIAAWSWGASRALDYLQTDRDVDAARVAVIGHSRSAKAALWASAQDERFALTVSNCSGMTGAALSRGKSGETITQINEKFPHWFARNYRAYNGREAELPLDQHFLVALMAPRPVCVASASLDAWADPRSEFLGGVAASPVVELLGKRGLNADSWPKVGEARHQGAIAYHLREGKHDLNLASWNIALDYADTLWLKR